jgi:hypothetical protein
LTLLNFHSIVEGKLRDGSDEETAGWQGDGVSVGFDASAEYRHVDQLKGKLVQLTAKVEALREAEEKMASEREGVETEKAKVESELEACSGGGTCERWAGSNVVAARRATDCDPAVGAVRSPVDGAVRRSVSAVADAGGE